MVNQMPDMAKKANIRSELVEAIQEGVQHPRIFPSYSLNTVGFCLLEVLEVLIRNYQIGVSLQHAPVRIGPSKSERLVRRRA